MNETITQVRDATLTLPAQAPLVRVTAGLGSAGQKTWNLRRAVTLIGSRRPAHIVLHDRDVSGAHCVIVNTGTDVLLKDLHSRAGTSCNKESVRLTSLKDGDVITVGQTRMQVAIQLPADVNDDSGCGLKLEDPLRFPRPVSVKLLHTDHHWDLNEAVVLIGRHDGAVIHLDHDEVAARHAVLFRFGERPAVFDLGGPTGLWVNGQRCSLTPLDDGDCLTVGPFGLSVHYYDPAAASKATAAEPRDTVKSFLDPPSSPPSATSPPAAAPTSPPGSDAAREASVPPQRQAAETRPTTVVAEPPAGLETAPTGMDGNISELWERLNSWQSRLAQNASALSKQESDLASRTAELDARDAALRGELHDLTRLNERLTERERDLARHAAQIQAKSDEVGLLKKTLAEQHAEMEQHVAELQRREHAVTQRWTRMLSATCPHCGKPIHAGQPGSAR